MSKSIEVFFSYAHEDEKFCKELEKHLSSLKKQGIINTWCDRDINAGSEWKREIDGHLNTPQIILLLVSPDFVASDYCYSVEMKRAMERHEHGDACVIPIILRPVYWQEAPFGKLQALPRDGIPITDSSWHNWDRAFFDVEEGIRKVINKQITEPLTNSSTSEQTDKQAKPFALLHTLRNYTYEVNCVAISPDGQILISSSSATIEVRHLHTRQLLYTLTGGVATTGHSSSVDAVVFTANGQTLFSGSRDGSIKKWNLNNGQLLHTIKDKDHPSPVTSVALTPNERSLISGGWDNAIKVWDLPSGRLVGSLIGHSKGVDSIAMSTDGYTLVSGSRDRKIGVWDWPSGQLLHSLTGHSGYVLSVAINPDGQILASGSFDRTIKLWNVSSAQLLHTLTGHSAAVNRVAISPDGQVLVSGSDDKTIKVWNLHTGQLLCTLHGHEAPISSVEISLDGQILATGSFDRTVKIWGEEKN